MSIEPIKINGDYLHHYFYFLNEKLFHQELFYFKMMSSMRKFRMDIPLYITPEYIENKCLELVNFNQNSRVKITTYRENGEVKFIHEVFPIQSLWNEVSKYEVEVFKDELLSIGMHSTIHCFKPELQLASIYAQENSLDDVILLNYNKKISRTLRGDLFLFKDKKLFHIDSHDGFSNQVLSQVVMEHFKKNEIEVQPISISPFETQTAEELFVVSESEGVFPITKIRNKNFTYNTIKNILHDFFI